MPSMRRVVAPGVPEILGFCAADPVERVFLEDVARRGLGRFRAVVRRGRIVALCHVGTNVVPSGEGCAVYAEDAARDRPRMIIGEERAVGELWHEAERDLPQPRDDRPGQPVYVLEAPPEPGETGLRPATRADLDVLVPACAAAYREEIGIDPIARDAEAFRWRTSSQIDDGRSWLWRENDTILFKAEASAWTPGAVQLQQVWVDPSARGRGYAQRGMRDLCRLLLERAPRVCLFVRPENAPAIRVYEAVGMRRVGFYRSLIF